MVGVDYPQANSVLFLDREGKEGPPAQWYLVLHKRPSRRCYGYVARRMQSQPFAGLLVWGPPSLLHPLSGAQKRAEMLCHPCMQGIPKQRGRKSKVTASTPPSPWAQKRAEMLRHPCMLGDPQTKEDKIRGGAMLCDELLPKVAGTLGNAGIM